jgi:hypothetical protein
LRARRPAYVSHNALFAEQIDVRETYIGLLFDMAIKSNPYAGWRRYQQVSRIS